MIKIKITVNGRHFNDINVAFQEIERALEESRFTEKARDYHERGCKTHEASK